MQQTYKVLLKDYDEVVEYGAGVGRDGSKEIYDKRRIYANGKGNFEEKIE